MYRNINSKEKECINKMFEIEFKGKDILLNQLRNADMMCEQGYDYISIKIHIYTALEPYPFKIRVPVEMRIFQKESVPLVCLMHVIDGLLDEFEIITADSSKIDLSNVNLDNTYYEVNREIV